MAEGRGKAAWAQTSAILSFIVNAHRDPKKGRASKPSDFNPYEQGSKAGAIRIGSISELRAAFTSKKW